MPFYRGDYYRGDYYRGDPFLGALAGAALRRGGAAIGRMVAGAARRVNPRAVDRATDIATGAGLGYAAGQRGQSMPGGSIPNLGPLGPETSTAASPRTTVPLDKLDRMMKGFGKKRRGMNPLNPKALRRALRRAEGFEKFAKKTVNALYKTVDGRRVKTFKKTTRKRS